MNQWVMPLCVLVRRGDVEAHLINLVNVKDSVGFVHEALAFSIKVTTLGLMLFVIVSSALHLRDVNGKLDRLVIDKLH